MSTVDPRTVHAARTQGTLCICLDVRTPLEHREVHAEGVTLLPLDRLHINAVQALRSNNEPVYLFCRSGARATQAHAQLSAAGLTGCHIVEGGTDAWAAAGLPVVRGKKGMSLERQVRIAAGFLVVLGVVLGATVHPWAFALSACVGTGLMFAGITDWCGLGLVLARMPWNQVASAAAGTLSSAEAESAQAQAEPKMCALPRRNG